MKKKIAWLIPSLIEGSGGHRTILQHAHHLEKIGYICQIYIEGRGDSEKAPAIVEKLFGYKFSNVEFGWDSISPADLVFATIWYSARVVRDLHFPCTKCYFVQDYEAMFNPMGDAYLMAENSYRYGLIPITIGRWLKHEISSKFNSPAYHFDFGADQGIYHNLNKKRELAVCFIYQPDKPRRCSQIGIEALGIVKHMRPDVKIYLYGSPISERGNVWYEHKHLGLLRLNECNELYNLCALGLCISSSNPSRIPFEMMAAGLPVVEVWRENNIYDMPSSAVSLSDQTPESIAENILRLLSNQEEREQMSQAGISFMKDRSLIYESERFVGIVNEIINDGRPSLEKVEPLYMKPPVFASNYVNFIKEKSYKSPPPFVGSSINSLPPFLQRFVRWGIRKAKKIIY